MRNIKDELIAILKNECGFTEKESINLLQSVQSDSEENLKKDVEKFITYINDIVSKDNVIRMIALGFTTVIYNSADPSDFDIALDPSKQMESSKIEQTTTISKSDMVDNASTPEDIAETNELESLRSMREAVQEILNVLQKDRGMRIGKTRITTRSTQETNFYDCLISINKVVNPKENDDNEKLRQEWDNIL